MIVLGVEVAQHHSLNRVNRLLLNPNQNSPLPTLYCLLPPVCPMGSTSNNRLQMKIVHCACYGPIYRLHGHFRAISSSWRPGAHHNRCRAVHNYLAVEDTIAYQISSTKGG